MSAVVRITRYQDGELTRSGTLPVHHESVQVARERTRSKLPYLVPDGDADVHEWVIRTNRDYHVRDVYTYEELEETQ